MEPLLSNERAEREWKYLCQCVGEQRARAAIAHLKGGQRAYPLNIARIVKHRPSGASATASVRCPGCRTTRGARSRIALHRRDAAAAWADVTPAPGRFRDFCMTHCIDWFDAGAAVLAGQRDHHLYPPLDDRDAQRQWLGGFGGAWADMDDAPDLDDILIAALDGRPALLAQLWGIGLGRVVRTVH